MSDNSYTPDSAYAQQVIEQLKQLQASMSQQDFAQLMQTSGIPLVGTGDAQNGVLDQQSAPGTGQMAWPQPTGTGFQIPQQTIQPQPGDVVVAPSAAPFGPGQVAAQLSADGTYHLIVPGSTGFGAFKGIQTLSKSTQQAVQQPVTTASIVAGPSVTNSAGGTYTTPLTQDQQSAIAIVDAMLDQAGLSSLAGQVLKLVQEGYTDPSVLSYMLSQTPEYQRRFSGNQQRIANGLGALSPAEYLATERAYQDVLRHSGLPAGFYDSPDDFANWISNDVSPQEIQARVNDALHFAQSTDPTYRTALAAYYGIDTGHIAAYFLDNKRAMPLLQKQAGAADIGAAALYQGLNLTNLNDALIYTDNGVTGEQARQAYSQIAGFLPEEQRIAAQFGQGYTQQNAEQELLGQNQLAAQKRRRLNNQEEALFGGAAGLGRYALGLSDQAAF